jgi:putative transposase
LARPYKAGLVRSERYVRGRFRYIELNPLHADLVDAPGRHLYTSFHCNELRSDYILHAEQEIYRAFGNNSAERRQRYKELLLDSLDADTHECIRVSTNARRVLGDDRFKNRIEAMPGRLVRQSEKDTEGNLGITPVRPRISC